MYPNEGNTTIASMIVQKIMSGYDVERLLQQNGKQIEAPSYYTLIVVCVSYVYWLLAKPFDNISSMMLNSLWVIANKTGETELESLLYEAINSGDQNMIATEIFSGVTRCFTSYELSMLLEQIKAQHIVMQYESDSQGSDEVDDNVVAHDVDKTESQFVSFDVGNGKTIRVKIPNDMLN